MMHKSLFMVIGVILLCSTVYAQNLPAVIYGGQQDERCYGIVEASDGNGYVMTGWTKSFGPGIPNFSNVLVIRVDSTGVPIWAKYAGGLDDDEPYSLIQTMDGGYAITGWTRSFGPGTPDSANFFVIKMDPAGMWQWGWVYGTGFDEQAFSLIQTQDGGYAVTGWTNFRTTTPHKHNIFLQKLGPGGVPLWTGLYWFLLDVADEGYGIHEIVAADTTHNYLITGRSRITTPNDWDAFVIRLMSTGAPILPASVVSGTGDEEAYAVAWDGTGLRAAGWTNSLGPGAPSPDILAWKDDTIIGPTFFGGTTFGWMNEEKLLNDRAGWIASDGGSAFACWTRSVGPGIPNPNFLILKIDTAGVPMWGKVHPSQPGELTEQAFAICEASNGKWAIAGFTNSHWTFGGEDFHMLVLAADGFRPECVIDTIPPELPVKPIEVDFTGEPELIPELEPIFLEDTVVDYVEICEFTSVEESETDSDAERVYLFATRDYVTIHLKEDGWLDVVLFDVSGRYLTRLGHGMYNTGTHLFSLPKNLSAGVYFVQVEHDGIRETLKLVRVN